MKILQHLPVSKGRLERDFSQGPEVIGHGGMALSEGGQV